jgi:hypothetical protein
MREGAKARRLEAVETALDGGWQCGRCSATNLRGRVKCYKCSKERPEDVSSGDEPAGPPGKKHGKRGGRRRTAAKLKKKVNRRATTKGERASNVM